MFSGYSPDGLSLMITASCLTGVSIILYALRAYAASKKNKQWRYDFIWVTVALVLNVVAFVFIERSLHYGLGQHVVDLSYAQLSGVIKFVVFFLMTILLSTTAAKFSIIALLIPVQGVNARNRIIALYLVGAMQAIPAICLAFMILTECNPVQKLWDPLREGSCPRRDFAHKWGLGQGAVSALVDFILALWPLSMVPQLQVSLTAKIGFCCLMGLGTITGLSSIYRDVVTQESVTGDDLSHSYVKLLLWGLIESTGIVILGTIPTLRPLFRKMFRKNSSANKSSKHCSQLNAVPTYVKRIDADDELLEQTDGEIMVSTSYNVAVTEKPGEMV